MNVCLGYRDVLIRGRKHTTRHVTHGLNWVYVTVAVYLHVCKYRCIHNNSEWLRNMWEYLNILISSVY